MNERLGVFGAMRRGFVNLRANWQLVVVALFQGLSMGVMLVLACLPLLWLGGVGMADLLASAEAPGELGGQLEVLAGGLAALGGPLRSPSVGAALVGSLLLFVATLVVLSFFQAGIYSILAAGERQALPGPRRSWRLFRTFELRALSGWGGRRLWRFFGLIFLIFAASILLGGVFFLGVGALAVVGEDWGPGAAFAAGCGGLLPLGFLLLSFVLWAQLAFAEAAREGQGMWAAAGRAVHVLGRRLWTVVGLLALWILLAIGAELVLWPASLSIDLRDPSGVGAFLEYLLFAFHFVVSAVLNLALAGGYLAICRDVRRLEAAP